jgi:hypothetical protein
MGRHKMSGFANVSANKPSKLTLGAYMMRWLDDENTAMFFLKSENMCRETVKSFLSKAKKTNIAKWRSDVATFWMRVQYSRKFDLAEYPLFTGNEIERDVLLDALCRTLKTPDVDGFDLNAFVSQYLRDNLHVNLENLMIEVL